MSKHLRSVKTLEKCQNAGRGSKYRTSVRTLDKCQNVGRVSECRTERQGVSKSWTGVRTLKSKSISTLYICNIWTLILKKYSSIGVRFSDKKIITDLSGSSWWLCISRKMWISFSVENAEAICLYQINGSARLLLVCCAQISDFLLQFIAFIGQPSLQG